MMQRRKKKHVGIFKLVLNKLFFKRDPSQIKTNEDHQSDTNLIGDSSEENNIQGRRQLKRQTTDASVIEEHQAANTSSTRRCCDYFLSLVRFFCVPYLVFLAFMPTKTLVPSGYCK